MKEREYWIDYLRSFIILTVVFHHAYLAYTTFAHFNEEAYILSSHPMVDERRWVGFDILVYFSDIFFMSLMFLISGFFVISSLKRKGARWFINDRFRRLFVPFIFGATIIAFLAYYPSYIRSHEDKNILKFIVDLLTKEYWPAGPAWFLWVLFFFNLIFVWIYPRISGFLDRLGEYLSLLSARPVLLILLWFLLTWIIYVPFRLLFGPEGWASLGPFDFQMSRLLLYFCYFILGTSIGALPLDKGVLSDKSPLMRNWPLFIILSLSAFGLLLYIDAPLKRLVEAGSISDLSSNLIYSSVFVLSCIMSCAAYLSTAKAIFRQKNPIWDGINSNSFTTYILHYIFIIWGQYMLLNSGMPVIIKCLIIAVSTIILCYLASHFLHRSKVFSRYL